MLHRTAFCHYLWCLNHSGWYNGNKNGISLIFVNNRRETSSCWIDWGWFLRRWRCKNWFIDWRSWELGLTMFVNTTYVFAHDECWININIIKIIFNKKKSKTKEMKKLILMYVDNFSGNTSIYLRILIYLSQRLWALWRNKNEHIHYWKSRKINSYTTISQFTIELYF